MKASAIIIFLLLLGKVSLTNARVEGHSANFRTSKIEDSGLWMITAIVSHNSTFQIDTTSTFMAGSKKWTTESHQSAKETVSGTIIAIVENQAENPAKDFLYHSDTGEPVSKTVTGNGSNSESGNSQETIDGILISANIRTDNVSGSARQGGSLYFEYSDETKSFSVGIGIKAVGSYHGRMYSGGDGYGEWKDYGGNYDDYSLNCDGGGDALNDKNCKMSKTGNGYQGSWKKSESKQRHTANGLESTTTVTTVEITVMPYKEPDKPVLTLIGCSELGVGENSMVVATGKPEGGTFRFWAEPSSMLTVETDGSLANITGASPGKGTLFVEYTTPEGKTNQTSQAASCVKVENYNGGQPIPQIALYDIDGKKLPGIKTVPVDAQPENASELVKFEPADPGVLTATGVGNEVTLQGLHKGKTNLQAKTDCGETIGPSVEVEVVNCDEETIARLEEMNKIASENQKQAYEKINEILSSEEFKEAADNIKKSTIELAEKTALTIITSGENEGAIETAMEVVEAGATLKDLITSHTSEDLNFNELTAMMKVTGAKALKAIAANLEVIKASTEFGKQLGTLIGTEEEMQNAMKWAEQANKQKEDIVKRQKFCRGEPEKQTTQTKQESASKTTSKPGEKDNSSQKQTTQNTEKSSDQQTTTDEPESGDTEVSPPPPTSEPMQVGLPYEPGSGCGCNDKKNITTSQQAFLTLQTGMENLGECVNNFRNGPLTKYGKTLESWKSVCDVIDSAIKAGPASFKISSSEAIVQIDSVISDAKSYDKEGKDFIGAFQDCPKSLESGVGLMQSAKNVPGKSATGKQPEIINTK